MVATFHGSVAVERDLSGSSVATGYFAGFSTVAAHSADSSVAAGHSPGPSAAAGHSPGPSAGHLRIYLLSCEIWLFFMSPNVYTTVFFML